MLRARLLVLPLLGLTPFVAKAGATSPVAAITRAAAAPFQDALRHDAAALCSDFTPAVAAALAEAPTQARSCIAAASRDFASTGPNEPSPAPGLSVTPTVQDLEVVGQSATLKLSFTFETEARKPGLTTVTIHHAGPIKLDLDELNGIWLVSSRARLTTLSGCLLAKPRRCAHGARVLAFVVGEVEPAQPLLELPPAADRQSQSARRQLEAGRLAVAQSGCLACHRIGDIGNRGPGKNLTHVGSELAPAAIARALVNPRAPMPSFRGIPAPRFKDIVRYLAALR
jgi:hypothetical protein